MQICLRVLCEQGLRNSTRSALQPCHGYFANGNLCLFSFGLVAERDVIVELCMCCSNRSLVAVGPSEDASGGEDQIITEGC